MIKISIENLNKHFLTPDEILFLYLLTTEFQLSSSINLSIRDNFLIDNRLIIKSSDNKIFTVFHPTRHDWKDKGNDIFLRAFVRFAKENKNVHLITINHGIDSERSMELVNIPEFNFLSASLICLFIVFSNCFCCNYFLIDAMLHIDLYIDFQERQYHSLNYNFQ